MVGTGNFVLASDVFRIYWEAGGCVPERSTADMAMCTSAVPGSLAEFVQIQKLVELTGQRATRLVMNPMSTLIMIVLGMEFWNVKNTVAGG